jgi:hypothetical protein
MMEGHNGLYHGILEEASSVLQSAVWGSHDKDYPMTNEAINLMKWLR